jgi:hypothetical protein
LISKKSLFDSSFGKSYASTFMAIADSWWLSGK